MKRTPTTEDGLQQFDHLPPAEAVRLAWTVEGISPGHHRRMQNEVRGRMPVLARALDRLARESDSKPGL